MTDSLLREVDEALRADRAATLWHRHKRIIIAAVVLLVIGTALNSGWQHYREARGGAVLSAFSHYQSLLEKNQFDEAAQGFATLASQQRGDIHDLALLWQGRALIAGDKTDAAIPVFKAASAGTSLWADIACLRLAGLRATEATCLNKEAPSPLAGERAQWAAAESWIRGDHSSAIASMEKLIANEDTSEEARARLGRWRDFIRAEKGE